MKYTEYTQKFLIKEFCVCVLLDYYIFSLLCQIFQKYSIFHSQSTSTSIFQHTGTFFFYLLGI